MSRRGPGRNNQPYDGWWAGFLGYIHRFLRELDLGLLQQVYFRELDRLQYRTDDSEDDNAYRNRVASSGDHNEQHEDHNAVVVVGNRVASSGDQRHIGIIAPHNNFNANNNEQHEDHNAVVVVPIGNVGYDVNHDFPEVDPRPFREWDDWMMDASRRTIRWYEDIFYDDPDSEGCTHEELDYLADEEEEEEEEPQPGGSRKRSREEAVDEEQHNSKRSRRANSGSGTSSNVHYHSDSSSDELFEDAQEELGIHETRGSRKRSREDFEEEEECLPVSKFRRCSNESTRSSDED